MYRDFVRALVEQDEDLNNVLERFQWKTDESARRQKLEGVKQAHFCELLMEDLKKPEDSAAYQLAKRYVDEARAELDDADVQRKDYERRRVEVEQEYFKLLNERLEHEKKLAEERRAKK